MTVKQFIYVGVGVFLAWLIYFVFKLPLFLSLPLALLFSLGGAALAFLPIDGRPMDVMIGNFIRSVVAPTQYTYEKQGGSAFSPGQTSVSSQIVRPLPVTHTSPTNLQPETQAPPVVMTAPPIPTPEEKLEAEEEKVEEQESELESEIQTAEAKHQATSELEQKLNEVMRQKEELEKELAELKSKLDTAPTQNMPFSEPSPEVASPMPAAPMSTPPIPPATPTISQEPRFPTPDPLPTPPPIPKPAASPQSGSQASPTHSAPVENALPDEPNLIKGAVKDARGNPLQNILVEVKDEEDNPVRAFKTNGKGEFASATSLPNGNYTIVLEDPKMVHKFDTTSIEATGGVVAPLGIISIDPREELRRELFN
jgi:hypothetical protein